MDKQGFVCTCGCGGVTRGGSFLPGHDAKYKSALFKNGADSTLSRQGKAIQEIERRGWGKLYTKWLENQRAKADRERNKPVRLPRAPKTKPTPFGICPGELCQKEPLRPTSKPEKVHCWLCGSDYPKPESA